MIPVDWKQIELFQELDALELEKVKSIFDTVSMDTGEFVLSEGSAGDEMFILVKGRVRISKSMIVNGVQLPLQELQDPRKILATLDSGVFPVFGEIALLDSDVRSASVETLEPSVFLRTDRTRFYFLLDREPVLGNRVLLAVGRRLATTIRKNNSELIKLTTALALALSQGR